MAATEHNFIYLLRPRPGPAVGMTPQEETAMEEHFARLRAATETGKVLIAGPCLDAAFGIVVFRAESEDEAQRFMTEDPAVKNGLMTAELHPFRVSLLHGHNDA